MKYFTPALKDSHPQAATTSAKMPRAEAEDLVRHLENAEQASLRATGELKQSRDAVQRTLPAIRQNYLGLEAQRLQTALAECDAARRSVEEAREALEIAKNLLIERNRP